MGVADDDKCSSVRNDCKLGGGGEVVSRARRFLLEEVTSGQT